MSEEKQTCGTCKYYRPETPVKGTCRRFPPQRGLQAVEVGPPVVIGAPPQIMLIPDCDFALTQAALWCGEYVEGEGAASEGNA